MTKDVTMKSVKAPKSRKIASLDRRKSRSGWFFILPFLIGFLVIYLPMIYESIYLSFGEMVNVKGEFKYNFVGLANYKEAILTYTTTSGQTFVEVLINGLKSLAFDLPAILIFSLFMAVMLNQKAAGRGLFRAIFFIPVVLSTGIMETIEAQNILSDTMSESIDDGSGQSASNDLVSAMDFQVLFSSMKVGTGVVNYVVQAVNNIFNIVNRSGVQMLIFLAGLQSISPAIYESCKIDGATAWETFWKITFPMISPMILVNGVYTIIDSFTVASNPVMSFISGVYKENDILSSAMAWIYFVIVILIVAIIASVLSAFVFYQRKND
ncbi:MAG: sugar ABC transporter permease [Ruminococcaceae bacterium]|nr:sugar ABC transporter permease [Oscillospiraceae bacterium]